ncbi:platelet-activating factor acetylhydrolase-like [Convolutriloba macropyga]|uniref:platelet-activating factor acetylhydrolase-like n=1 Tax=Convolutriloba macropyga TaxID=536237 RepID=UPI003F526948
MCCKYLVPATPGAPLISGDIVEKLPVLVFSHGLGGTKQCYSTVCCELASQGFVVAAVEHRDGSASFTYSIDCLMSDERRSTRRFCESDVDNGFTYVFNVTNSRFNISGDGERDLNSLSSPIESHCNECVLDGDNHVSLHFREIGTCVDYGKTLIGCFHGSSELQIGANGQVTLTSQLGEQKLRERNGKSDSIPSPSQYWSKCWQDFHFYKKEVLVPFKIAKKGEDEFILRNKQIHQRGDQCVAMLNLLLSIHIGEKVYDAASSSDLHNTINFHQFQGRLDMTRVAVVGHSFGGGTSVCALAKDPRFKDSGAEEDTSNLIKSLPPPCPMMKCAVALDAWMHPLERELITKVQQPVLFVNSDKFQWPMNLVKMKKMESRFIDRIMVFLRGTVHQSQGDFPFLLPPLFSRILEVRGKTDPKIAMQLSNRASLAFLRRHLDIPDPTDWWGLLEGKDDRVIIGTNAPLRRGSIGIESLN